MAEFDEYANARIETVEVEAQVSRLEAQLQRLLATAQQRKIAYEVWQRDVQPLEQRIIGFNEFAEAQGIPQGPDRLAAFQRSDKTYKSARELFLQRFGLESEHQAPTDLLNIVNVYIPRVRAQIENLTLAHSKNRDVVAEFEERMFQQNEDGIDELRDIMGEIDEIMSQIRELGIDD